MNFNKFLKSLFGDKSSRDMKLIQPFVEQVKAVSPKIEALDNDALRARTKELQQQVQSSAKEQKGLGEDLMALFVPFGKMAADGTDPASAEARAQARSIQDFITKHYYTCSDEVFLQLGRAYGAGGEFTQNINEVAGEDAAEFAAAAIEALIAKAQ